MKYLFIGGVADGKWIDVEGKGMMYIRVPQRDKLEISIDRAVPTNTDIQTHDYIKRRFANLYVYCLTGLTIEQIVEKFVNNYKL